MQCIPNSEFISFLCAELQGKTQMMDSKKTNQQIIQNQMGSLWSFLPVFVPNFNVQFLFELSWKIKHKIQSNNQTNIQITIHNQLFCIVVQSLLPSPVQNSTSRSHTFAGLIHKRWKKKGKYLYYLLIILKLS